MQGNEQSNKIHEFVINLFWPILMHYTPRYFTPFSHRTVFTASLHNSSIRIGSDGLSLVCGDDLDKTQPDESATDNGSALESTSEEKTAAEKEAEQLGKGRPIGHIFYIGCKTKSRVYVYLENT